MNMTNEQAVDQAAALETSHPATSSRTWRSLIRGSVQLWGLSILLVAVGVFFASSTDDFLTYSNLITILATATVIGLVATGQTFPIIAGGFDLSVAGVVPLGAVAYAKLVNGDMPAVAAILLVVGIGAAVGLANGLIVTKLRINPLIATLGTLSITGGLALQLTDGVTISFDDAGAGFIADTSFASIPWAVWVLVALILLATAVLRYTVFGRSVYALGGNREATWLAGVRVDSLTCGVYAVCGAFASFAGVVVASQLLAGSGTVGSDAALMSVAAVILGGGSLAGGVGSPIGTFVGVLVLGALANGMALMHVSTFYQQIATGVVLLAAVAFGQARERLVGE